jgi:hypothetical protein
LAGSLKNASTVYPEGKVAAFSGASAAARR